PGSDLTSYLPSLDALTFGRFSRQRAALVEFIRLSSFPGTEPDMPSPCSVTIAGGAQVLPRRRSAADGSAVGPALTVDLASIEQAINSRLRKKIDRFSQIALLAAGQLESHFADADKRRVGVFLGNDLAGWTYVHDQLLRMIETGDPMTINPYV